MLTTPYTMITYSELSMLSLSYATRNRWTRQGRKSIENKEHPDPAKTVVTNEDIKRWYGKIFEFAFTRWMKIYRLVEIVLVKSFKSRYVHE
jgi:hypothetical protein